MSDIELPRGLLDSVRAMDGRPAVLLLRHGDRPPVAPGKAGDATPLTPLGELRAAALGVALGAWPGWCLSSPLVRCVQTARQMGLDPVSSALLGAPGPFVVEPELGGLVFESLGTRTLVRGQVKGETYGCLRPLAEGTRLLREHLVHQLRLTGTSGCAVSHDAIIVPFIACLTGHGFRDDWLDPLDGIVVAEDAVVWRGQRFEVSR
ncbi:MAG: histidine phosphatase family protein [Myxococcota bacterium]